MQTILKSQTLNSQLLIELQLLPSIEYFCALERFEHILLEKNENFIKQSYRNRTFILTANGPGRLTIPLVSYHKKVLISEVEIDYTTRWQMNFSRTLESAYAKSPFYEHYSDDVKKILFSGQTNLFELNKSFLSMCLQWLRWEKSFSESVTYEKVVPPDIADMRSLISAKKDFLGREIYLPHPYQQVFGSNFAPNMSLLDLVFCEGPRSGAVVKASQKRN
ncbi:WbqC family protein [soil metagenome]